MGRQRDSFTTVRQQVEQAKQLVQSFESLNVFHLRHQTSRLLLSFARETDPALRSTQQLAQFDGLRSFEKIGAQKLLAELNDDGSAAVAILRACWLGVPRMRNVAPEQNGVAFIEVFDAVADESPTAAFNDEHHLTFRVEVPEEGESVKVTELAGKGIPRLRRDVPLNGAHVTIIADTSSLLQDQIKKV